MINETLRENINVDKLNSIPLFNLKEGDNAILKLALFKNSTEFDITGQTVRLGAKTKNGLIEQIDGFTISKNNLDIKLKNSILVPGKVEIDLEIKDSNGSMTTASFFITVNQKVLNDEAVEATNEFDTFTKTVDKIESDYTGLRRIIIDENQAASLQDQINNVNSSLDNKASKNEVIKKGHVTLNDCDGEMLTAIQGGEGTSFELLSIPRDNSVDLSKLNGDLLSNKYKVEGSTRNWARVSFKLDKVYKDCVLKAEFYCTPVATSDVAIQTSNQKTNIIKFVEGTKQFYSVKATLDSTGSDCFILTTVDGMTYNLDGVYENIQIWVDGNIKQITECIVRDGSATKVNPEVSFLATQNFVNEKIDDSLERDIKNNQVKLGGLDNSLFGTKIEIKDSSSSFCTVPICKLKNKYLLGAKVNVSFSYYPTEYNGDISIRTNGVSTPSKNLTIKTGHKIYCEWEFTHDKDFTSLVLRINSSNVYSLDGIVENLIVKINDEIVSLVFDDLNFITILENNINGLATLSYVDKQIQLISEGYSNKKSFELPFVNNLYVVQGSKRKQSVPIFIDYLYNGTTDKILFDNGEDRTYIREAVSSPNSQSTNILNTKQTLKFKSETLAVPDITFNRISIEEITPNGKIRLLIIGDSVTAGAITEKQYWAVANELFAMEDIDRKRTSDVMFLGSNNVRKTTLEYGGVTKEIKACACGVSSWSLTNWLTSSSSHFVYDKNGTPTFSVLKWIERYRTHLDDGTKLELGDSRLGSEITSSNINNIQCCTPNIIYINSTHNGGTIEQHEQMIEIIKTEIPNCKIIVGNPMPLAGTWHKEKYVGKDWMDDSNITRPNYNWGGTYGTSRIESLIYYTQRERENNDNTFYFMPQCVTMPTVESLEYELVDCGVKQMRQVAKVNQLPKEHPSTLTHKIWGYELYALLKYISGIEQGVTNNFDTVPLFD